MKKNVFFFANIFPNDFSRGITKKVFAQIRALENLGYNVLYYTGYTSEGVAIYNRDGKIIKEKKYIYSSSKLNRITRNKLLKKMAKEFLDTTDCKFNFIYLRYLYFDKEYIELLKSAKENSEKVLIEAHSYPVYNAHQVLFYPVFLIDMLYNRKAKKYVDLVVAISYYNKIWGIDTIGIENGVDIHSIQYKNKKNNNRDDIKLIVVGYEWDAHGYDRILCGIKEYYEKKPKIKVSLTIVGTIQNKTKQLIDKLGIGQYIEFKGKKFGDELEELYSQSDIGIGALRLFNFGISGDGVLKTREYLAHGIPYIYSGDEQYKDFYNFRVPTDDSPVNIQEVIDFYIELSKDAQYKEKIIDIAYKFSWENQLKKVIKYMNIECEKME